MSNATAGDSEQNARAHAEGIRDWYAAKIEMDDSEGRAVRLGPDGDEVFLPEVLDVTRHVSFQLSTSPSSRVMATPRLRFQDARMEALTQEGWKVVDLNQAELDGLVAFAAEMHAEHVPERDTEEPC